MASLFICWQQVLFYLISQHSIKIKEYTRKLIKELKRMLPREVDRNNVTAAFSEGHRTYSNGIQPPTGHRINPLPAQD